MTPNGLKYSLKEQGSAPAVTNNVYLNHIKMVMSGNDITLSGPKESFDVFKAFQATGSLGGSKISTTDSLDIALRNLFITSGPSKISYKNATGEEAYVVDFYLTHCDNDGQLIDSSSVAKLKIPSDLLNFSYVVERTGATTAIHSGNGLQELAKIRFKSSGAIGEVIGSGVTVAGTFVGGSGLTQGYVAAQLSGHLPTLRPTRIIPNGVHAFFHPELEEADAAVLYHSTDPRHRFAWAEGRMSYPFHGEMVPFRHGILARLGTEAAEELQSHESNPLTMREDTRRLRLDVVRLDGIVLGRTAEEAAVMESIAGLGLPKLTREVIFDVEEARRY